jgi:L-2-hydroxyglutarate oxidase LhgO
LAVDVEIAIIGAGVVGLAIGAALAEAGHEVTILERNDGIGQETSSRSSEVIHAGIYYPRGSLKAQLCVEGKKRLYRFAAENAVDFQMPGKLIVATSSAEEKKLHSIAAAAQANGVDDLGFLSGEQANDLEPEIACTAALISPSTGIIDSHGFMVALEGHLTTRGGSVVLNSNVCDVALNPFGGFALSVISGGELTILTCHKLVVSAGHGMALLAPGLPRNSNYDPPPHCFAKGHYFTLKGRTPFRHLVYPVPVEGGLGTHLTLDLQGRARFGPDVQWVDTLDYAFDDQGGVRLREFEKSIRQYWPGLPERALEHGYTGIRPKISAKGEPARDFAIHGPDDHGIDGMVALYGIESPGITSSLAIGAYVAALLRTV